MPVNRRTSKPGGDLDRDNSFERHDNRVGRSADGRTESTANVAASAPPVPGWIWKVGIIHLDRPEEAAILHPPDCAPPTNIAG